MSSWAASLTKNDISSFIETFSNEASISSSNEHQNKAVSSTTTPPEGRAPIFDFDISPKLFLDKVKGLASYLFNRYPHNERIKEFYGQWIDFDLVYDPQFDDQSCDANENTIYSEYPGYNPEDVDLLLESCNVCVQHLKPYFGAMSLEDITCFDHLQNQHHDPDCFNDIMLFWDVLSIADIWSEMIPEHKYIVLRLLNEIFALSLVLSTFTHDGILTAIGMIGTFTEIKKRCIDPNTGVTDWDRMNSEIIKWGMMNAIPCVTQLTEQTISKSFDIHIFHGLASIMKKFGVQIEDEWIAYLGNMWELMSTDEGGSLTDVFSQFTFSDYITIYQRFRKDFGETNDSPSNGNNNQTGRNLNGIFSLIKSMIDEKTRNLLNTSTLESVPLLLPQ